MSFTGRKCLVQVVNVFYGSQALSGVAEAAFRKTTPVAIGFPENGPRSARKGLVTRKASCDPLQTRMSYI